MKFINCVLSSLFVMVAFWFISNIIAGIQGGMSGLITALSSILTVCGIAIFFGIIVGILNFIPWRINAGLIFAFVYFFFAFPLPPWLGGPQRYWWAYPVAVIQIVTAGLLYSYISKYLNNRKE